MHSLPSSSSSSSSSNATMVRVASTDTSTDTSTETDLDGPLAALDSALQIRYAYLPNATATSRTSGYGGPEKGGSGTYTSPPSTPSEGAMRLTRILGERARSFGDGGAGENVWV
jgi:hypothetical protein